ncbi:hypothetical protein N7532_008731 [Penicillium argentinense]|uniref:NmrA-like domain-containing protein n=1 Tax=Penicillium argentinense TaxID=1131581 RepID=A0A9W9K2T5_9EURO|nr:uncharacterized protein N7532_008731 [Penicillium argentinense]KAJ5090047.1 hypothetical protein N7532_008731 [Penicillium argentinense]
MPAYNNVIVFGATGAVGSAAALRAHKDGAKVSLAVRDPSKPTPQLDGIPAEKVQADLTQPETVKVAVHQTGAKAAFIYAVWGAPDHMRPALRALKEAGIEFVVFLSSFSIETDIRAVPSDDFIPLHHAEVEIALEEVFGNDFVAIRPAYFASNIFQQKHAIAQGEVKLPNPDAPFDWISPDDIGDVSGAILVSGQRVRSVGLLGPEKLSLKDAVGVVASVLGKKIDVTKISEEEASAQLVQNGLPPPLVNWLIRNVVDRPGSFFSHHDASNAVGNIQKYSQHAPQRFQEWVEANKDKF